MMNRILYENLENALIQLEAGEELETILAAYPELVPHLRPVLDAAQIARQELVQEISPEILNRSRTRVLAHAMQLRQGPQPVGFAFGRFRRLAIALVLAFAFLLSWGGLVVTSAQALPGDQLYPAKLTLEKARLGLTFTPQSHHQVEELYQSRRVDEIHRLLALGRIALVEFHGVVEKQETDKWIVSGIDIRLYPTTILIGKILPGMTAEVEGLTQPDGTVQASEIHLQTFGFVGYVESISSQAWQIAGKTVQITPDSRVASGLRVGDWVVVSVRSDDFGNLTALIIAVSSIPTPTQTPLPTATSTLIYQSDESPGEVEKDGSEHLDERDADDLELENEDEPADASDQEDSSKEKDGAQADDDGKDGDEDDSDEPEKDKEDD